MHISEICTRSLVTCNRDTPAAELARKMRDQHVADVVVVDDCAGRTTPVGVVTDRDLVVGVLACNKDPTADDVAEFLASELSELSRVRKRHPTPLP